MSQSDKISMGSPRSRAMNPVVVKMPPPIMLLISKQTAVNQPILERATDGSLTGIRREHLEVLLGKKVEIVDEAIPGRFHLLSHGFFRGGMAE